MGKLAYQLPHGPTRGGIYVIQTHYKDKRRQGKGISILIEPNDCQANEYVSRGLGTELSGLVGPIATEASGLDIGFLSGSWS